MSSEFFKVHKHILEASHIRTFPRTTSTHQDEVLHISIKQYTPLNNTHPKPGDVTIIAAHANAFPKELYEPLWDELLHRSKQNGFAIRGIWIADVVHQGQSGVLNEGKLGNDPAWLDHSRDLLHMVNTFRKDMPRPIVGIGHSMGGAQLAYLGLLHPRLMETLILVDPVVQRLVSLSGNFSPAFASANRRDKWPSREEAAKAMLRSKFYQAWDPRVFERWIKYGLRDLPTQLHPKTSATPGPLPAAVSTEPTVVPTSHPKEVTLTTTKHQEVMTFLRPNYPARPGDKEPSSAEYSLTNPNINRRTHPDLTPTATPLIPFYRGESMMVFQQLPHLRPSVLYVFGALSFLTEDPALIEEKMVHTGTGVGGSGGRKEGRVDQVMVQGAGHLIPMEKVEESAEHAASWIGKEMGRWRVNEKLAEEEWGALKGAERSVLTERFVEELAGTMKGRFPVREKNGAKL